MTERRDLFLGQSSHCTNSH